MELCNLHSHTTYCDGSLTAEKMVRAAIAAGCKVFGFSGHSYFPSDPEYSMSLEHTAEYKTEINRLKDKYADKIEIYLGVEQDYYTTIPPEGYDYIIGSVHYLKKGGEFVCVDAGETRFTNAADLYFGGDRYALIEEYFSLAADVINKTGADIVGHFDLVTKYNDRGRLFDESSPRYVDAALAAMERILEKCRLFEVNTGAMYRLGKPEPYPSVFLLKELQKRGGEVILSSDSHDAESICYKFGEMRELLAACGFRQVKRLTKSGFADVRL